MAVIYSCLCENGPAAGSYFDSLSAGEKLRYGTAGAYRCYGALSAWFAARAAATSAGDTEVLEICDAFSDNIGSSSLASFTYAAFPAYKIIMTTRVNGQRSAGFHGGNASAGYELRSTGSYQLMFDLNRSNIELDGIRVWAQGSGVTAIRARTGAFQVVRNCIGRSGAAEAFRLQGIASKYYNNIAYDSYTNFQFDSYSMSNSMAYNNLSAKGNRGFYGMGATTGGNYHNNVSIGCTTNWAGTQPGGSDGGLKNNAGESGDTPWGDNPIMTVSAADFVDYANNDFRLAAGSALRDAGFDFFDLDDRDIIGKLRPSYSAGALTDAPDIGPFEFDNGVGEPPVDITVSGMAAGSMIRAARVDNGEIIYSGAGPSFPTGYIGPILVEVRCASAAPFYKPWATQVVPVAGAGAAVTALQELDE